MPGRRIDGWLAGGLLAAWAGGCGGGVAEHVSFPDSPAPAAAGLLYAVAQPTPFATTTRAGVAEFAEALDRIRLALPRVAVVHVFFDEARSTREDWLAILDVCQTRGVRAVVGFATVSGDDHVGFRPLRTAMGWELGSLGRFVEDHECISHPALYAVAALDEPWHAQKRPFYTTDELKELYSTLKSRAPETRFNVLIQFSREIWRHLVDTPRPGLYWDRGVCDVVQISALELRDGLYLSDLLDANHYWSRRIIHEKTPEIPLWTSVQVMGSRYGPGPGYWFPRERDGHQDLLRLLTDLTAERYEAEHPLTGMMLQAWDSLTVEARAHQYRLGDRDPVGSPVSQADAARDALWTLEQWMMTHRSSESVSSVAIQTSASSETTR